MNCFIKLAEKNDIHALIKLEETSFDTDKISQRQFSYLIKQSSALVMVAKIQDMIAGSAIVLFRKNSNKARLYSIAVDSSYRKQGIGQTLYQTIENKLVIDNYTALYLEVKKTNHQAIQFYLKNGFQMKGELKNFYEDGSDGLRMQKVL